MPLFGIILGVVSILLLGAIIVVIILLLIEGALYIWGLRFDRALARHLARKRIK